jgi:hypothetical protein
MREYLVVLQTDLLQTGIFIASSLDNLLASDMFIEFLVEKGVLELGRRTVLFHYSYVVFDINGQVLVETKTQPYQSKVSWECMQND